MQPDDVRRDWAERDGDFSPAYYAKLGPNEVSDIIADIIEYYADEEASILELGCGSGRHLAHVHARGYEHLAGIDINPDSFDVLAEYYPDLARAGTFHTGALEDILPEFEDDAFDVVYSVETLQHIHPDDEWVFDEVVRVTGDLLVTAENEGNGPTRGRGELAVSYVNDEFPLYHRNWKRVFGERGLAQIIHEPTDRDTVRAFRVV